MAIVTWTELAMAGIAISYLLSVLIYMLSYIFTSEVMRAWAKGEIQVAFLTLILFASLASLSSMGFVIEYGDGAQDYLNVLYKDAIACQATVIEGSNSLALLASFTLNINPSIFSMKGTPEGATDPAATKTSEASSKKEGNKESQDGGKMTWGAGISLAPFLQPILMAMSSIHSYFFIPLGMLRLHIELMGFVIEKGTAFLMPLGIFLRAFKFSRNAGNLLIALFISLYFILPAMYLFSKGVMVETMGWKSDVCESMGGMSIITDFAGPLMEELATSGGISAVSDWMYNKSALVAGSSRDWLADTAREQCRSMGGTGCDTKSDEDIVSDIFGKSYGSTDAISPRLLLPPDSISYGGSAVSRIFLRMGIEAMFLPMLSIIISLGIAREIAATLGSDVDFSQLVRLV